MKDEDVKVGMKVLPHSKLDESINNVSSIVYLRMLENNLNYVYVSKIPIGQFRHKKTFVLSNTVGGSGDYYYSSDFESIKEQRKQKLIKLNEIR